MKGINIKTTLPVDLKYHGLLPQSKLVFWNLLCNPYTERTGIYEISVSMICDLTELTRHDAETALRQLQDAGLLIYDAPLVFIRTLRELHNWTGWNYKHKDAYQAFKQWGHLNNRAYDAWRSEVNIRVEELTRQTARTLDAEGNAESKARRKATPSEHDDHASKRGSLSDELADWVAEGDGADHVRKSTTTPLQAPSDPLSNPKIVPLPPSTPLSNGRSHSIDPSTPSRSPQRYEIGDRRQEEEEEIQGGGAGEGEKHASKTTTTEGTRND